MDRLYGAQISPTIRKRGETQCLGFVASFIDDRFVSRNEPLLEPAAELLGELLLDPVTRGPQTEPEPPRRFAAPSQPRLVTEEMDVTQGKLSMVPDLMHN